MNKRNKTKNGTKNKRKNKTNRKNKTSRNSATDGTKRNGPQTTAQRSTQRFDSADNRQASRERAHRRQHSGGRAQQHCSNARRPQHERQQSVQRQSLQHSLQQSQSLEQQQQQQQQQQLQLQLLQFGSNSTDEPLTRLAGGNQKSDNDKFNELLKFNNGEEFTRLMAAFAQLVGPDNVWRLANLLARYCKRQHQEGNQSQAQREHNQRGRPKATTKHQAENGQPEVGTKGAQSGGPGGANAANELPGDRLAVGRVGAAASVAAGEAEGEPEPEREIETEMETEMEVEVEESGAGGTGSGGRGGRSSLASVFAPKEGPIEFPLNLERASDRRLGLVWLRFLLHLAHKALGSLQFCAQIQNGRPQCSETSWWLTNGPLKYCALGTTRSLLGGAQQAGELRLLGLPAGSKKAPAACGPSCVPALECGPDNNEVRSAAEAPSGVGDARSWRGARLYASDGGPLAAEDKGRPAEWAVQIPTAEHCGESREQQVLASKKSQLVQSIIGDQPARDKGRQLGDKMDSSDSSSGEEEEAAEAQAACQLRACRINQLDLESAPECGSLRGRDSVSPAADKCKTSCQEFRRHRHKGGRSRCKPGPKAAAHRDEDECDQVDRDWETSIVVSKSGKLSCFSCGSQPRLPEAEAAAASGSVSAEAATTVSGVHKSRPEASDNPITRVLDRITGRTQRRTHCKEQQCCRPRDHQANRAPRPSVTVYNKSGRAGTCLLEPPEAESQLHTRSNQELAGASVNKSGQSSGSCGQKCCPSASVQSGSACFCCCCCDSCQDQRGGPSRTSR